MKTYFIAVRNFGEGRMLDIDVEQSLAVGLEEEFLSVNGVTHAMRESMGCDMRFHIYLSKRLDSEDVKIAHLEIEAICKRLAGFQKNDVITIIGGAEPKQMRVMRVELGSLRVKKIGWFRWLLTRLRKRIMRLRDGRK